MTRLEAITRVKELTFDVMLFLDDPRDINWDGWKRDEVEQLYRAMVKMEEEEQDSNI